MAVAAESLLDPAEGYSSTAVATEEIARIRTHGVKKVVTQVDKRLPLPMVPRLLCVSPCPSKILLKRA
jgi:hypothetical protein